MAKLPDFAILHDGDYEKLDHAIASGKLEYPTYIFDEEKDQLIFINADGTYTSIKGNNHVSVQTIDSFPTAGELNTLYILDDTVYYWDEYDEDFYPTYNVLQGSVDTLSTQLSELANTVEDISGEVSSLSDLLESLPLKNMNGTYESPIVLNNLKNGLYSITGQYQIDGIPTVFLAAHPVMFMVNGDTYTKTIIKYSDTDIEKYTVSNNKTMTSTYVTDSYLVDNEYVTQSWVNQNIGDLVAPSIEQVTESLDGRIDDRVEDLIEEADESDIIDLFGS